MKQLIAGIVALAVIGGATAAFACEAAGKNAHMGTVTAIDGGKHTITLKDAETGKPITFTATSDQLKGVKVKDEVVIAYSDDGGMLRVRTIRKG